MPERRLLRSPIGSVDLSHCGQRLVVLLDLLAYRINFRLELDLVLLGH